MSKRRKKPGKTFQQRQTERKLREQEHERELDAVVEDMASTYSCSTETTRDFAHQCSDRIDDLAYDLDCGRAALVFWSDPPPHAAPVLAALRDLVAEHERHEQALVELHQRLMELTSNESVHHHLELPVEHYRNQLRLQLFPDPDPRPVQNHAVSGDH